MNVPTLLSEQIIPPRSSYPQPEIELPEYPAPVEERAPHGGLEVIFEDVEFKEETRLTNLRNSEEYRQSELLANHTCQAYGGGRAVVVLTSGLAALGSGTALLTGGIITAVKTHSVTVGLLGAGGGLVAALGVGSIVDLMRLKQIPQVISNRKLCLAALEVLLAGGCLLPFFLPVPE